MSNSGMISDCDADRRHRGDLGLLRLEESLKACFAFFNVKAKSFFGPRDAIMLVLQKVTGLGWLP